MQAQGLDSFLETSVQKDELETLWQNEIYFYNNKQMKSLKEFLKEQLSQPETKDDIDTTTRINEFNANVEKFYDSIEHEWLGDLDGMVQFRRAPFTITEELLGTYSVQVLKLRMHRVVIEFRPVGTLLIGSPGRIDMYVNHKETPGMFLMIRENVERLRPFSINFHINGEEEAAKPATDEDMGPFVWKYFDREMSHEYIKLNAESFQQIILNKIL